MKSFVAFIFAWSAALGMAADFAAPEFAAPFAAQVGPRPYYLVDQMAPSALKTKLASCANTRLLASEFSIAHRGAPLQFPEHTKEGYLAAARMGAGIVECDVTFTQDGVLVCRHSQCDLHATTDILRREDLRSKCHVPPQFSRNGAGQILQNPAQVSCCASDLTLTEFRSLCGKMDGANRQARQVDDYLAATPPFRTDLYNTCGTLLTHAESVELLEGLGVKHAPELKGVQRDADGNPALPNHGFAATGMDQRSYADRLFAAYGAAKVDPSNVFAQSFDLADLQYWLEQYPEYARNAVYLIGQPGAPDFSQLHADGIRTLGVPIGMLLSIDGDGALIASDYAQRARAAGLNLIAWTAERSGRMREDVKAGGDFYYLSIDSAINDDGAVMEILHALATQAEVIGVFSDWPGTVTYYANCMGR
jgi:glycerophosphoryl diester phosphodiesterase